MLGFIKKCFFTGLAFLSILTGINWLSAVPLNAIPLSCNSTKNQECKVRPQIINVNGDDPVFFHFSIKTNKCSCNDVNNLHAKLCVSDAVKTLNVSLNN